MTNFIVYLFISGAVLFIGLFLATTGALVRARCSSLAMKKVASIALLLGTFLTTASGVPYPFWIGWCEIGLVLGSLFCIFGKTEKKLRIAALATTVCAILIGASELYFQRPPAISTDGLNKLFVVGDSLSMGADPPGKNWPDLLGEKLKLTTRTFSFGGAQTGSALANAKRIDDDAALVILEIGGNDLLYGAPDFPVNLERLLQEACKGQRRVVMVELPLPPFYVRYGSAQRSLARKYGVTLIPKRILAGVITGEGATTDSLHLSNRGHEMLADAFSKIF